MTNITGFTESQTQALMDLLVMGMYADHNLASAEEACLEQRLTRFKFSSEYERRQFIDASFTRARRHTGSPEARRAYVLQLAERFATLDLRRSVYDMLDELLTSDGCVTGEESQLLSAVKEAFQL